MITSFLAGAAAAGSLAMWLFRHERRNDTGRGCTDADTSNNSDSAASSSSSDALIYMDYNGTTPIYPAVLDAMLPYLRGTSPHHLYGNPNSSHAAGDAPRAAVNAARRQILTHLLGCDTENTVPLSACIFTACGTESDNLAIHLALESYYQKQKVNPGNNYTATTKNVVVLLPHVVTCNVEHAAIDGCLATTYEATGRCTVTRVHVQTGGRVTAQL